MTMTKAEIESKIEALYDRMCDEGTSDWDIDMLENEINYLKGLLK